MPHLKTITCLDIGTSKITTIIAQLGENKSIPNIIGVSSVVAKGFKKGQIINLEQASHTITESIESAERMAGIEINQAFVSLTAPHFESINSHGVTAIGNPNGEITTDDIFRAIEAAKAITLPPNKEIVHCIPRVYTVDGQDGVVDPIGMNGIRLEVDSHLIVASTPAIKNLTKCLEDINIKIISLAYSGLTASLACLSETENELGVALIDIGGYNTTVTVFIDNSPACSFCLPIGSNNITADLAIGLRLPLIDAEKIKIRLAQLIDKKGFNDEIDLSNIGIVSENNKLSISSTVNGIVKPRVEEIIRLVWHEICNRGFQNLIPAGIVFTGGGAQTVDLKTMAAKIIPLPIRISEPVRLDGLVDDITFPSYSSAIGSILFFQNSKQISNTSGKKINFPVSQIFSKIKDFLSPLLP
ncbi:MAG: cell division protein FtsA [Candidatus Shapirobacteria bacterium]